MNFSQLKTILKHFYGISIETFFMQLCGCYLLSASDCDTEYVAYITNGVEPALSDANGPALCSRPRLLEGRIGAFGRTAKVSWFLGL